MEEVLARLRDSGDGALGLEGSGLLASFADVCDAVGFNEYYEREAALSNPVQAADSQAATFAQFAPSPKPAHWGRLAVDLLQPREEAAPIPTPAEVSATTADLDPELKEANLKEAIKWYRLAAAQGDAAAAEALANALAALEDHQTRAARAPAPIPSPAEVSAITADLKALITEKNCGPIMIRLSWHDVSPIFNNLKDLKCSIGLLMLFVYA